jgi:hypothetical protein
VVDPDRYAVGYKHAQTTDRDPNTQTDPNAG